MAEKQKTEAKRRGPFELSSDARILYNVLETALIKEGNELASYQQLSAAIGRDVQKDARGLLATARRLVQNEHKILLEAVQNTGIKRSDDYEGAADKTREHVRRTIKRRAKEIGQAINGKDVTPILAAKLSIMNVIMLFSQTKAPQRLIETIQQRKLKELSTADTLRLFQPESKANQDK